MKFINHIISLSIVGVFVAGALYIGGKYSHSVKDVFAIQESPVSQKSSPSLEETVNPIDPYVEPDYVVLNPDAPPLNFDTFSAPSDSVVLNPDAPPLDFDTFSVPSDSVERDSYASRIREALSSQSTEERINGRKGPKGHKGLRVVIDDYICERLPTSMMIINGKYVQDDSKIHPAGRPMTLDIIYGLNGTNSPVTALESLYDLMTGYADEDHSLRTAFVVYARKALDLEDAAPNTLVAKTFPCQELSKKEKERERTGEELRLEKEQKGEQK